MKKLLTVLFLVLSFGFTANATTYYVSNSGSDNNSGTSTSAPWKTLAKVSSFTGFLAGDAILFNRGEVFYGMLKINNSGSSGKPITYGAYGSGADPIITGFTTVSTWTNLGSNIWESTSAVSTLSTCNMVAINGVNTPMGRYPNTGYLTYQSFSGNTSITSSSLSGTPNWTGAEAVIRKQRWIIDRNKITAQSGGTLTYTPSSTYFGQSGYGFFIQNDSRTLDQQNEWYYNSSTKKLRIYNSSTPANVQIVTKDTLVYMKYHNYITFDNLSIQGSNKDAFVILSSSNVTIQNCSIDYSGYDAIWGNQNNGQSSGNFVLKNSTINHTNNNAINLRTEFAGALISHNIIRNTGMIVGVGGNGDGMSNAIQTKANNAIVEYNEIDSVGYIGIGFYNNNTIVRNNFVNGSCFVKLDGAGIYTWVGTGNSPFTGQKVLNNIVLNGKGDNAGTNATGAPISHGIYIDDWSANIEIAGNTVANNPRGGLYIHKAHDLNIHNNTSFNNGAYQVWFVNSDAGSLIRNDTMKNNIFVSKLPTQTVANFASLSEDVGSFGIFDNNCYAKPISDNLTIELDLDSWTKFLYYTLAQHQTYTGLDPHSYKSPKTVTDVNDIRFEYNPTSANKTISLDANYIDVKNISYNGTITLAPYTSAVLIKNGAITGNQSPTANAGSNQTITLPTSTVSLSGSGTDPNGTISAYNWIKISGPSGTITSATTAATTVTALVQGVYQFQLKVTDNAGAAGLDTVQVTVNATGNISPTANAGSNQTITLPTSTVSLSGSGTDPNGTISAYNWIKISGPSGTITSATTAATTVTALVQGVYQFQLKVTDNAGAAGLDTIQVTVNAASSLLPAVNPANTVNGMDYKYYEGSYSTVPIFSTLTPLKTGTSSTFDITLANRADQFAFNFTGFINVPSDGQYTFYTTSDDGSNLYIDNVLVVNNDGLHSATEKSGLISLAAGKHAISVGFFEQTGDQVITVSYAGPGISKQVIPASALFRISTANTVNGLDYKYYEGNYSTVPIFSTLTPVKTGTSSTFDITLANRADQFAFNFTGFINILTAGQYTFYTYSDDGSNLYIDGVLVVNNDGLHSPLEKSGIITLTAGKHAISVGFFEQTGGQTLTVSYAGPGISKQIVPASALYRVQGTLALNNINQIIISSAQVGIQAYPNPFVNSIMININGPAGEYELMLVNVSGQIIWTGNGTKAEGSFQQSVNTSALQKGIYILRAIQNNNTSVIKLEK